MTPGMPAARVWFRPLALLLGLWLAGCASEQPAPQTYPPLDFSYLPPLALNVARLDVQNQYVSPGPPDVSADDPVPPAQALRLMATERLRPVGSVGRAVFVIDDAAMVRSGDTVTGAFSVTLNIYTSSEVRAGFAEATVSRQLTNIGPDLPAALYTLTRQLMQQMNVEFEYQVRRSLRDWLVSAGPPPSPIPEPAPLYSPPPPVPAPPLAPSYTAPPAAQPIPGSQPPLPYSPPPAGPLPEPAMPPPPPMPPLPSAPPPAGALPAPTTKPPPQSPPLPAPLPPLGPVQG